MAVAIHEVTNAPTIPGIGKVSPVSPEKVQGSKFQSHLRDSQPLLYGHVEEGTVRIASNLGITHASMPLDVFRPPDENSTEKELKAWDLAKQYEVMLMAEVAKELYVPSQKLADEAFTGEEENMFAPELSKAFAEAAVESGTEFASNSLARHMYFEILGQQGQKPSPQALMMDV